MYALEHTSTFSASLAVIELSKRGLYLELYLESKGMKPPVLASIVLTTTDMYVAPRCQASRWSGAARVVQTLVQIECEELVSECQHLCIA